MYQMKGNISDLKAGRTIAFNYDNHHFMIVIFYDDIAFYLDDLFQFSILEPDGQDDRELIFMAVENYENGNMILPDED